MTAKITAYRALPDSAALLPCPFCGGTPELVDNRVEWFVRCNDCKPYPSVIYGESKRNEIDYCETDEEAQQVIESINWEAVRQSAIDKWNKRAD